MDNTTNGDANIMPDTLLADYLATRQYSLDLSSPLEIEDFCLQAAEFVSPPKWHLAHTSWFFETFILQPYVAGYRPFQPAFEVLFNSYYNAVGEQYPRPQRGLLSRPTISEVREYRQVVDQAMQQLLLQRHPHASDIRSRCRLGIEHEKQHQELLLTDIKYSLFQNPLYPNYVFGAPTAAPSPGVALQWQGFEGGVHDCGLEASDVAFCYDNETPRHKIYLEDFQLANRLVSNREYQAFIDDGGYRNPRFWLADGWSVVDQHCWHGPLYWLDRDGEQLEYSLYGLQPRQDDAPVCHLSGYEADAYANWAGARLPTEAEWEIAAARQSPPAVPSLERRLQPTPAQPGEGLLQLYDNCWQWTASAYRPYPGYQIAEGAIGEYNGKFMCNQWVLRGGSCASSDAHLRPSYRNFFYPQDRWQFSGIRLARQ